MGIENVSIHRIRLRGFWESAPLPDGGTRQTRPFGQPRLPTGQESVWIVWSGRNPITIHLNGTLLGEGITAVEVTNLLRVRNTLALDTVLTATEPEIGELVCLELRTSPDLIGKEGRMTSPDSQTT